MPGCGLAVRVLPEDQQDSTLGLGEGALSALGTPQGLAFVNKAAPVAGESPQSENLLQCGKRRL